MLEKWNQLKSNIFTKKQKDRELTTKRDIITGEQEAWMSILGTKFEIPPVPDYLKNPVVNEKLKSLGMEPVYIPKLHLGTLKELKSWGEIKFINEMSQKYFYPNWKRYEGLTKKEKGDHRISRNLNEWYWREVKNGRVDFPELKGGWAAIETMPKPSRGEKYSDSTVTRILGFSDRFGTPWNNAVNAMKEKKDELLAGAGLPINCDVRLPEATEWNLLANRFGWGKTNSYEWTNTEHRLEGISLRLIIGDSTFGGAAKIPAAGGLPDIPLDFVGFRVMIGLPNTPRIPA